MKTKTDNKQKIKIGTILIHSIGCGCDNFYQVIEATPKMVTVRKLKEKIVNRNIKSQSFDVLPMKDKFEPPSMTHKYLGGYKEGKSRFKEIDANTLKLKIADDGHIGPIKRMIWWNVWDGKKQNQYFP